MPTAADKFQNNVFNQRAQLCGLAFVCINNIVRYVHTPTMYEFCFAIYLFLRK